MKKRLIYLFTAMCVSFTYLTARLSLICTDDEYKGISERQNTSYSDSSVLYANIYDRNLKRLVNENKTVYTEVIDGKEVAVSVTERYSQNQLASHAIGYLVGGEGACGIELDCDEFLRSYKSYSGVQIRGNDVEASSGAEIYAGVITTIDKEYQKICENVIDKYIKRGALVLMDVQTGEILSTVSRPDYSPLDLKSALLDTENSPLINRVNQAYNLGSIFKLVVAAAALEDGYGIDKTYECNGIVNVDGVGIRCHKTSGHGLINMTKAMDDSCNCYFINLGMELESAKLLWMSDALSFGRIIKYTRTLNSKSGSLPTFEQLENNIEKANFSFGQGKLTATPLQVAVMTSAFANSGKLPSAHLIIGTTNDGAEIDGKTEQTQTRAISESVANKVRDLMVSVVEHDGNIKARPKNVTAGGKTATAQTGQYNDDGTEKLNCWFTGFFPADEPKYALTILSENGKSALSECGAAFSEIADNIYAQIS